MTQQFHSYVYIQKNLSHSFKEIQATPHSLQHHLQLPRYGSHLSVLSTNEQIKNMQLVYTMKGYSAIKSIKYCHSSIIGEPRECNVQGHKSQKYIVLYHLFGESEKKKKHKEMSMQKRNRLTDKGKRCSVTTQRDRVGRQVGGGWFRMKGIHVYLWPIHTDVWKNPSQYCNHPPIKLN